MNVVRDSEERGMVLRYEENSGDLEEVFFHLVVEKQDPIAAGSMLSLASYFPYSERSW